MTTAPTARKKGARDEIAAAGRVAMVNLESQTGLDVPVGEERHFDHVACGDARGRLYVKKVTSPRGAPGYVSFCHNCGVGGATYANLSNSKLHYLHAPPKPKTETAYPLPGDYEPATTLVLDYLKQYGLSPDDAARFGVGWSEQYQRIVLPVRSHVSGLSDGDAVGCQLRRIGLAGPKYITMRASSTEPLECQWLAGSATAVLVEDLLSAWKVWLTGLSAIPLLGSHIRPERLAQLVHDGHKDFVVWLDNDRPEIHQAAEYIKRVLVAMGARARRATVPGEPKHYSYDEIHQIIRTAK